jgi:hypothetical protein
MIFKIFEKKISVFLETASLFLKWIKTLILNKNTISTDKSENGPNSNYNIDPRIQSYDRALQRCNIFIKPMYVVPGQ